MAIEAQVKFQRARLTPRPAPHLCKEKRSVSSFVEHTRTAYFIRVYTREMCIYSWSILYLARELYVALSFYRDRRIYREE